MAATDGSGSGPSLELKMDRIAGANKRMRKSLLYSAYHQLRTDVEAPRPDPSTTHVMIPDASALLGHLQELLELPDLTDVLLLQSVWQVMRQRSGSRSFARLRAVEADKRRRIHYFANEHCAECFSSRSPLEHRKALGKAFEGRVDWFNLQPGHYDSVCRAAAWYSAFVALGVPVVVVTESEACVAVARASGLEAQTWTAYLQKWHPAATHLLVLYESLAAAEREYRETEAAGGGGGGGGGAHAEYLGEEALAEGVKRGTLLKGTLRVSKYNAANSFVQLEGTTRRVLVPPSEVNRALCGDKVAVQLLPEADWAGPSPAFSAGGEDAPAGGGERMPTGRVVGVLERTDKLLVATFQADDSLNLERGNTEWILAVPLDPRFPKVRLRTRQAAQLMDSRVVVRADGWEPSSRYPHGHYVRELGPVGDLQTETQAILVENGITVLKFTDTARKELPELPACEGNRAQWEVPPEEAARRRDLRATHRVFSIDPPGCQDIDDALSARALPGGGFEVGVHIADVSHFVRPGSMLDAEARSRGTTVYLTDRRFNMIPEALSENLCSLRQGVDRLAMSCIWEMDSEGRIVSSWFGGTVIRSCNELAYQQAQDILGGDLNVLGSNNRAHCQNVRGDLEILMRLATAIRARRKEAGGLDLESAELQFLLDDQHQPTEIHGKEEKDVNWMVAEWMIAANGSVAKRIHEAFPTLALLRCHGTPDQERMDKVAALARKRGVDFDCSSNRAVAQSLLGAEASGGDAAFVLLLKMLTTRGMREALYMCTGQADPQGFYHYGLALEYYTHFTSPIRRYADLLVHRILRAALGIEREEAAAAEAAFMDRFGGGDEEMEVGGGGGGGVGRQEVMAREGVLAEAVLCDVCDHINERNRASKRAQSQCTELFLSLYFKDRSEVTDAIVFDVRANGLLVLLPKYKIKETMLLGAPMGGGSLLIPKAVLRGEGAGGEMDDSGGDYVLEEDRGEQVLRVRGPGGGEVLTFKALDRLTVRLQGEAPRTRLPHLRVTLEGLEGAVRRRGGGGQREAPKREVVGREALMHAVREREAAPAAQCTAHDGEGDAEFHLTAVAEACAQEPRSQSGAPQGGRKGRAQGSVYELIEGMERVSLSVGSWQMLPGPEQLPEASPAQPAGLPKAGDKKASQVNVIRRWVDTK